MSSFNLVRLLVLYQEGDMPLAMKMASQEDVESFDALSGLVKDSFGRITNRNFASVLAFVKKLNLRF